MRMGGANIRMQTAGILVVTVILAAAVIWVVQPDASKREVPPDVACDLPDPLGPVLLEISVRGGQDGQGRHIALDRAALDTLPQDGFRTRTLWTDGEQVFRGVRLKTMMRCLGIEDGTLTLHARNAYVVDIPVRKLRNDGALIATHRNGAPMSVRDKGPLWLVYHYDGNPAFRTESIYAQSIWQLDRIEIAP